MFASSFGDWFFQQIGYALFSIFFLVWILAKSGPAKHAAKHGAAHGIIGLIARLFK